ncbi:HNH endonuclease signature motif containing protein [Photobacterium toruni]|uniref:HNH endonuclease n=1 Tax=Photobacterium toruni TaxID=1935446 RepID=A0A1T4UHQ7_9GAMM|nr:HNH endonuclease signature motif containing protein [Photobacterium toruni]SKA52332.1 hypothetical protein CZ814_03276 [Photobacterium toruni]
MSKDCGCPACNPVNQRNFEYVAPRKLTLKERIHKQRMENLAASDRAFEYVKANETRYAEHRASIMSERKMAKAGLLDALENGVLDTAHYVGGITKSIGDKITSDTEAFVASVIDNPSIIQNTVDNIASTLIDGITYFPDVVIDEVAPTLSYGAKSRTNQRIDNALTGVSDEVDELGNDFVKHNKAIKNGDFETAGKIIGKYASSMMLPTKKIKAISELSNESRLFKGVYKGNSIILKDVDIVDLHYKKRERSEYNELRKGFNNNIRKDFLKDLSLDDKVISQLKQHGVGDSDILKLSDGKVPRGYQVHHKVPLDDGGTNDKNNLVLIRSSPEHSVFTTYQKQQTSTLKVGGDGEIIEWPIPNGNVYPKEVN